MALLEVEDLKIHFPVHAKNDDGSREKRFVKAVDGVSFKVERGSVLGIVGESGCGKSTLVKGIMRLLDVKSGKINLMGKDLLKLKGSQLRKFRRQFQMIFQDPEASLNPRFTVGEIIAEPIRVFEPNLKPDEVEKRVQDLMVKVGLSPYMIRRYPHEFSGGQRQRICIARSLSINPELLICDESVSALDVSIQAQIINLLNDLKKQFELTYLFISHDLAVTRYISDYIMVMYLGKVVEMGKTKDVMLNPKHPYTKALISAVPQYHRKHDQIELKGEIPSPMNPPQGCSFHTRCPQAKPECSQGTPVLEDRGDGQMVSCFLKDL